METFQILLFFNDLIFYQLMAVVVVAGGPPLPCPLTLLVPFLNHKYKCPGTSNERKSEIEQ